MQVVKRHFRPEFLNRLDDVVIFEPLGTDHLRKIARLQARFIWTLRSCFCTCLRFSNATIWSHFQEHA